MDKYGRHLDLDNFDHCWCDFVSMVLSSRTQEGKTVKLYYSSTIIENLKKLER